MLTLESIFLPKASGVGTAQCEEKALPFHYSIRLSEDCVTTLETEFNVDTHTAYELANRMLNFNHLEDCRIEGTTDNGCSLSCHLANLDWTNCDLRTEPLILRGNFNPREKIIIRSPDFDTRTVRRVVFGITNMEGAVHRPLSFTIRWRTIKANPSSDYAEARNRLRSNGAPRAVTYEFSIEISDAAEIVELEEMVLTVTMMLSLVQMNDIKPLYSITFDDNGMPFQWIFYTNLREAQDVKFFNTISDDHIPNGISSYLTQCYDEFDRLHKAFNLYPFLHSQLFAAKTSETHFIALVLIISLEYLVTHYGMTILGWGSTSNLTLIAKLKRLNKHLGDPKGLPR